MSLRITRIWAWLSTDNPGGDEGIVAHLSPRGIWLPLIGADADRLQSFRELVQQTAEETGQTVTLARFDVRTDVETLQPTRKRH